LQVGMMLTWLALAILVRLNAAVEDIVIEYKGSRLSVRPAFEHRNWDGIDHKPERRRDIKGLEGVWRVEGQVPSMEWADKACRAENPAGRLIQINSKERYNELVEALYKVSTDIPYWIGLNDKEDEGQYMWQTCESGGGKNLKDEMNLPFDNPNSYWGWLQPSKEDNPWGNDEDCGQLAIYGPYAEGPPDLRPTDGRPVNPADPKMQFRFNDVSCSLESVFAMPLCELVTEEEKQLCEKGE